MDSNRSCFFARRLLLAATVLTTAPAALLAQQRAVVRGTITSDSGRGISRATVVVAMAPVLEVHRTLTDSAGRYEVAFDSSTGDFQVSALAIGFRPVRQRVTKPATQRVIVVDLRMASAIAQLAGVRTIARPSPLPGWGALDDPTTATEQPSRFAGAVPPDQSGDLNAVATTIPGITTSNTGALVAFGMPGQVQTAINGMSLSTADLPPDLRAHVEVATTPYDATVGGSGAGRINLSIAQGGRIPLLFGRTTLSGAVGGDGGPVAQASSQPTAINASGTANGPFGTRDMWYNTGAQFARQWVDNPFADPRSLAQYGIAPDSLTRLAGITTALGIPTRPTGVPGGYLSQSGSILARIDRYKDPLRYRRRWDNALSLTVVANLNRSDFPGNGITTSLGYGSRHARSEGQLFGTWTHRSAHVTSELAASIGGSASSNSPYSRAPGAAVEIRSLDGSANPVQRAIALGGFPLDNSLRSASTEVTETLHFYLGDTHDIKVYGRSVIDVMRERSASYTNGLFSYRSLEDLRNNRPESFQRTLGASTGSASLWRGAAAVTDLWRVGRSLRLFPGFRLDVARPLQAPAPNPAVEAAFGVANDRIPNVLAVSPRIGFVWQRSPSLLMSTGNESIGAVYLPPTGTLSGGIGEFRNDLSVASLVNVRAATGLANGPARLACFGSAAPVPDWRSYVDHSAIPGECADGAGSPLIESGSTVALFGPEYGTARSWRGNLQWGSKLAGLHYLVNAVYSYNLNQPGFRNLNFAGVPAFTLTNERQRPVFVSPSGIDATSGTISPAQARRSSAFGRVTEAVSDLHSTARQITFTLEPELSESILRAEYTLSSIRAASRGFDESTFGSPDALETTRSPYDVRHRLILSAGKTFGIGIGATIFWRLQSGIPFMPMVGSDVNGDGLANDRAFIFDPDRGSDPNFASGMQSLLQSAPASAKRCLDRQLNHPAAANACDGPWSSTLNAALRTPTIHVLGDRQAMLSLDFSNVLAGADQLLHGSNGLRGWGGAGFPDQILYNVRGFDPQRHTFTYAANPKFGSTNPLSTGFWNPFRLALSMRIELGRPKRHTDYERFLLMDALREDSRPAPLDSILARVASEVPDSYHTLLRKRDTLLLTAVQIRSLDSLDARYSAREIELWREAAAYIDAHRRDPDFGEINRRLDDAAETTWELQRAEIPRMLGVLYPAQAALARTMIETLLESEKHPPGRFTEF